MLFFTLVLLFSLISTSLADVTVQVNFVDTSVPTEANNLKVCEAVYNAFTDLSLNASECIGRTPKRKSYQFILNVEDVLIEGVTSSQIVITPEVLNQTNSYLEEAGFFILPSGKVSLMLIPQDLKYAAYVAIIVFMIMMPLILLLLLKKAAQKKKRVENASS